LPAGAVPDDAVTYGGLTKRDLENRGVSVDRLCAYVEQVDTHLPFLTVRETAAFSHDNSCPSPPDTTEGRALHADKLEAVTSLLALEGCIDTIIGDDLVRGVSGGEKKRVTIAETLVTNARVLCMDEISTGLDAAVTFNIIAALRAWARSTDGTAVVALLQPTPEVFEQFDHLLLLREGAPVYHGPRAEAAAYFGALGFAAPAPGGGEDVADWLVNLVASPAKALAKGSAADVTKGAKGAPLTTKALKEAWRASGAPFEKSTATFARDGGRDVELATDFAKKQYGVSFPHGFYEQFRWVLKRQYQITIRNKLFMTARVGAAVMTSLILGSVWFDLPAERGFEKLGMLLFCVLHISFSNFSELTFSVEQKYVAYKHLDNKMFPGVAYIAAWSMVHLPIALMETAVFSCVLYPMVGLSLTIGNWAFFYLNLVLANIAMASFFRIVALVAPDMEAAQTFPGPVIAVFIIFAGFLITPDKMGALKFVYYISLFAYSLRSLCQNEFLSDSYDARVAINPMVQIEYLAQNPADATTPVATLCANGAFPCTTMGKAIMAQIQIDDDTRWLWGGAAFCAGFFLLTFAGATRALAKIRIVMNVGSSRAGTDEETAREAGETAIAIKASGSKASLADPSEVDLEQHAVKFTAMSIAWRDLEYSVNLPKEAGGGTKQLLQSVTSAARPNRMLALMGASGAGKTTLLDVIAGRKTGGVRKGTITLNGHEVEKETFARCTAYCEQMDLHNEFATVAEALEFSAKLRLGEGTTAEARHGFVSEALDILELRPLAGRMIGSSGSANGLSPGQRKVLTVAVELVSNAPVFFLDEPTSGLDSRAALVVMTEVHKVAKMGRTVISTIHQPSTEIFLMFDDLLLLQRGGWQVYFGPLGANRASTFVEYMETLPFAGGGQFALPRGMNPASWMLDVLGGTDSSNAGGATADSKATGVLLDGLELETHFKNSPAGEAASKTVAQLSVPAPGSEMFKFSSPYARSFATQLATILARSHLGQMRDVGYNCGRIGVLFILYILFGVIYVDLDTSDEGGVQSMVSVVFMTTIFTGIICMNAVMPVRVRERAVSHRERSSFMYDGVPYAISHALIEIPWIALIAMVTVTPLYFLVGMVPTAEAFFFHVLINVLVSYAFLSVGQTIACMCSTIQTAQAGTGAFIPIAFLFGGLYLPLPQIPVYWKWAYYINPVAFAIQSVVAPQFQRRNGCSVYDPATQTGTCPTIVAFRGTYFEEVDSLLYVEDKYDVTYAGRWLPAVWLVCFCVGAQALHVAAAKFVNTVNR
jgi:ABC-type multidrug transport system ATPase subunit/ABC-type multidrug transport system permease subunit